MNIKYISKNYKITDNFKEVIERKLSKLERYFTSSYDIKVNCTSQSDKHKLEITINADGFFVRGEVISDEMYNNIDLVMPKIEKQILKTNGKNKNKFKRVEDRFEFLPEMPELIANKFVKSKQFELAPILPEEAELQMEALGHNFYIFLNVKTGLVSVVYKRNDSNLGLIEIIN